MLSVYDPTCDGLRDPHGIGERARLSWRLGSDEADARQVAYDVVVVSMRTGDVVWESGRVESDKNAVELDCSALHPGETCSWFVTVWDNHGNEAYGVPAAFVRARGDEAPTSAWGEQRTEFVWTSDARLNAALEGDGGEALRARMWREVLGLTVCDEACGECGEGDACVRVEPGELRSPLDGRPLSFARGSMLLSRGLLVERLEAGDGGAARLEFRLPPGVRADTVF